MRVLADVRVMSPATWVALCDGERQEYIVSFSGEEPATAAVDLMGALAAARIRARRASIAQVVATHRLVAQAQHVVASSKRSA